MKAAVLQGPRKIEIEDIPDPEVEPDGIVVKVRASGICGSDLHPYKLSSTKMVLGHESSAGVPEVVRVNRLLDFGALCNGAQHFHDIAVR